jgi:hypothetical protein
MRSADLVELFDLTPAGALVEIDDGSGCDWSGKEPVV